MTATKKKATKKKAKKAAPNPPSVTLSDATLDALKEAKVKVATEHAKKLLNQDKAGVSIVENFLKDAGAGGEIFLHSDILDCLTKGELIDLAGQLGIELAASWSKPKMIATMIENPALVMPREFNNVRPRI